MENHEAGYEELHARGGNLTRAAKTVYAKVADIPLQGYQDFLRGP